MNKIIGTPTATFRQFKRYYLQLPTNLHDHHKAHLLSTTNDPHPLLILWRHQILDPDSDIVTYWSHVFLLTSILALFIDPLYFFLPYVDADNFCFSVDLKLAIVITCFRSITDLFFLLHIIMKFRTAFVAPNSRVFGRGDLVMDAREIAIKYLKSDFCIDLAAALPLPQILIWVVIPATINKANHANNTLSLIVLLQYIPKMFQIFPLHNRIVRTTGFMARSAWAGAVYNLILFILASHTLGASWYLLALGRQFYCWTDVCKKEKGPGAIGCVESFLNCASLDRPERQYWQNITKIPTTCDINNKEDTSKFAFGMFADAFTTDIASSPFTEKYLYSLWWGLRNLTSYGQTLETTVFLGENLFCIGTCILGLVLSAALIGNMQTNLQSMTVRVEEWRIRRRDTEEWMRHRQLPPDLQERVRRFVQYKWLATRGVEEEEVLSSLPVDLRREIQRHLCLSLVRRVPFFSQMDDQLLDAICGCLTLSLSTEGTYIFREGDPVEEMIFIIRGQLESSTTNGGRSGFFNSIILRPGEFCGEELLTWALMPKSSANLPSSTRTVRALSEVEAFALEANDLKFVAQQFKRLQSKKLQDAFRYYSHQWRAWAACLIQSFWRKFQRRKMAREFASMENPDLEYYSQYAEGYDTEDVEVDQAHNVQHLGATILASKFAKNTKKGKQQKTTIAEPSSSSLKMPQLFKPAEPDFDGDREDV